jgi:hypothetical protein
MSSPQLDRMGRMFTMPGGSREAVTSATATFTASTTEATVLAAGGAGVFHDVVLIVVANTSAATATRVDIRATTGGTVIASVNVVGGATAVLPFSVPLSQPAADAAWTAQCSVSTTDVRVFITAVKAF